MIGTGGPALKLLMPCVRAASGRLAAGLAFAALASAAKLAMPWTLKFAIDDVFQQKNLQLFLPLLGGLMLACVLRNAFVLAGRRVMLTAGEKTALSVRRLLFTHLQSLSIAYHKSHKPGESLSRIDGDVSQVESFVEVGIPKTINTLLLAAGVLVMLFWANPLLAGVALVILPVHLALYIAFKTRIKAGNRTMREHESGLASGLVETLLGAEVMSASGAEEHERRRFYERASNLLESRLRLGSLQLWQEVMGDIAVGAGTVGVYYYGGRLVMSGAMTMGEFTAFLGYMAMLYPLSLALMTQMSQTLGAMASAERIMDTLELVPDVAEAPGAVELPAVAGAVSFEGVAFGYGGQRMILRDMSFRVDPGDVVAVTGPVGSGKSTIGSLLARFYDASKGRILIDGMDLGLLSLRQVRREVGIVFQEPFLFADTIAGNIRYSRPSARPVEVAAAADAAGLTPLLQTLPKGIDTMIGDGGIQLSLGQKHQIDMARALLKDPRILILDSVFTEGDDTHRREQERLFRAVSKGRTTFVINPSSFILENADKVVRLRRDGSAEVENRNAFVS